MQERLVHIGVLAWAALVETVRRKDLFVVWLLALFGLAAGGVLGTIGVRGAETFLRDISLTVVNTLAIAVCIWLAARQIPEELERRTLFPLLARPVRRFDVLLGKFLAVWLLSALATVVLALTAWVSLSLHGAGIGPIYFQYVFLRVLSCAPIAALTMTLSLVMSPPATVILAFLLTLSWSMFARTLAETIRTSGPLLQLPLKAVYFVLPHLDLFDLSQRAAYNYAPVPAWVLGALTLYALAYAALFLGLGEIRFRKMAV